MILCNCRLSRTPPSPASSIRSTSRRGGIVSQTGEKSGTAFVGVSYYLSAYVSPLASLVWSIAFWLVLVAWGVSIRDRGLVLIGLFFAALYAVVGFGLPLLRR